MVKYNLNILTSFIFLIPAMLSLYYGVYWHFFIILFSATFSILFHLKKEKSFKRLDKLFLVILMMSNFYLLYLSGFIFTYTILVIFFVTLGFNFLYKAKISKYNLNHSLWHLSSVIITLLCVLAYVSVW